MVTPRRPGGREPAETGWGRACVEDPAAGRARLSGLRFEEAGESFRLDGAIPVFATFPNLASSLPNHSSFAQVIPPLETKTTRRSAAPGGPCNGHSGGE